MSNKGKTNGHGKGTGAALITGASSGIGRGLALALAARGLHVVAAARRRERLDELVRQIVAAGGSAEPLVLDVADGDATYAAVRAADERLQLDVVVANAGVGAVTPAKQLDWTRVKSIFDTNLTGAAATICAAVPGMLARRDGRIVAIASVAGFNGLPRFSAYSASKAALITFCESLRVDLRGSGVTLTTVSPGYVLTDMLSPDKKHPFAVDVDTAVRHILTAVDRRAPDCSFPTPTVVSLKAAQLLPRRLYERLAARAKPKY